MFRKEKGFTIIELLTAVMIIGVGILALGYLMRESGVVSHRVKDRDVAIGILNGKMEIIRDTPYADIVAGETIFVVPSLPEGTGTILVTYEDSPVNHLRKVVVSVHWKKWGAPVTQTEALTTYVTRGGLNP